MDKLLDIAKQILDINPYASLTGTLMLRLVGIDLDREPHDIDILLPSYAPMIKMPNSLNIECIGFASDGCSAKYKAGDIIIDVLSNGEEPILYNGLKLGTVSGLMKAKYVYSQQNNEQAEKHYNDLVKMGFNFPIKKNKDDLPF